MINLMNEIYDEEQAKCLSSLSEQYVNMSIDGWSNVRNEPMIYATITTEDGRTFLYETIEENVTLQNICQKFALT